MALLLLALVGVTPEAIAGDYALSGERLRRRAGDYALSGERLRRG